MTKKPDFERSIDTRLLLQRLVETKQSEVVPYTELSEAISRPVSGGTSNLQSALRIAFNDYGMVFSPIRGVGYRRLTDGEIVEASGNDVTRIRRASKRAARKLFQSEFSRLSNEDKIKHNTHASIFGAVSAAISKKTVTAIEKAVTKAGRELPVAETLKLFAPQGD